MVHLIFLCCFLRSIKPFMNGVRLQYYPGDPQLTKMDKKITEHLNIFKGSRVLGQAPTEDYRITPSEDFSSTPTATEDYSITPTDYLKIDTRTEHFVAN